MLNVLESEKNLTDSVYFVIDTETAPRRDFVPMRTEIIELGWAIVTNGVITEKGNSLVKPAHSIPHDVSKALGITNEMVNDSPGFLEVFRPLSERIKDTTLVGHNVRYDIGVIIEVCERRLDQNVAPILASLREAKVLDTMKLFSRLYPQEKNRRLKDLLRVLGVKEMEKRHRAGVDANYTAQVLIKLLSTLSDMGIEDSDFLNYFIETGKTSYQRPLL